MSPIRRLAAGWAAGATLMPTLSGSVREGGSGSCRGAAAAEPTQCVSASGCGSLAHSIPGSAERRRVELPTWNRGSDHCPAAAGRDVRHRARGARLGGRRPGRAAAWVTIGRGEAAPIDRYDETPESARAFIAEHASLLGDDPFALEEIGARLGEIPGEHAAKAALDAALHDLQGKLLGVPVWRLLGLPRVGPPTSWTIWLGDPDDMARRTERRGGEVQAPQAEARRRRRPRCRARPRGPVADGATAAGRRQRMVVARRGARGDPAARRAGCRVRRAAAPRRRPRRRGAEGALADPDLRRRGLPHARAMSPAAPRSPTGSTSSSRSREASARRSGWPTLPALSGSA